MKELEVVKETKLLVPILSILSKALFEENSYLISKALHQSYWATQESKIRDGLLWLLDSNQDVLSNIMEFRLTAQF